MKRIYGVLITIMIPVSLFAQGAIRTQRGNPLVSMLILFLPLILIWYFLLIRPQQKREKERREMLQQLTRGTKVVTVGGIYGVVDAVKDNIVVLKIADKVKIEVSKNSIAGVVKK